MMIEEVKAKGDPEAAEKVRQLADEIESGDISDFAFVCFRRSSQEIGHGSYFNDRMKLVGGIEMLKNGIINA